MEKEIHENSDKEHILLTSLGARYYKDTEYEWSGETATADFAPLALLDLFPRFDLSMPNRIIAVVTADALRETWPAFKKGVPSCLKITPEYILIPDGRNSAEIRDILGSVADPKYIPRGADLTLDVTQGFRHFPFIFYALVLYLKSLRGVEIRGAYYGMAEAADPKPIIDLQPLIELPDWFHAVRMFRDQGTTKPMAEKLEPLKKELKKKADELRDGAKKPPPEARELYQQARHLEKGSIDSLKSYAFAYESALPLELGKASTELVDSIQRLPSINSEKLPPLVVELTTAIKDAGEKTSLKGLKSSGEWKREIPLNPNELKRQADMIDLYLERDQLSLAVGLMREWVVSWLILKSGKTKDIQRWWDNHDVRPRYERRLGAILASARNKELRLCMTPAQKEFRTFWDQLADKLRNVLHHHAMRSTVLKTEPKVLPDVKAFWDKLKKDELEATGGVELPPLGGRLLISPQGGSPGVLFSALKVANPDTCLVICSDASILSIDDAASTAGFKGHIEKIKLSDPIGGFAEIDAVTERVEGYLTYADKVIANITGGSTLMGVIVQRLVEDAQKLDCPVERFALIDRRPTEEQDKKPFVESDSHWLD